MIIFWIILLLVFLALAGGQGRRVMRIWTEQSAGWGDHPITREAFPAKFWSIFGVELLLFVGCSLACVNLITVYLK